MNDALSRVHSCKSGLDSKELIILKSLIAIIINNAKPNLINSTMLSLSTVVDSNLFRMAGNSEQVHSFLGGGVALWFSPIRVHSFAETVVCLGIA